MPKFHDQALKQRVQDLEQQLENAPEGEDTTDLVAQLKQARADSDAAFDQNRATHHSQQGQGKGQGGQGKGQGGQGKGQA